MSDGLCFVCAAEAEFGGHWIQGLKVVSRHVCAEHRDHLKLAAEQEGSAGEGKTRSKTGESHV
jgi:hypothetical protein